MPTREEILAARTEAGGWTRAQLAAWGVPWPPPKGWKARLEKEAQPDGVAAAEPLTDAVR